MLKIGRHPVNCQNTKLVIIMVIFVFVYNVSRDPISTNHAAPFQSCLRELRVCFIVTW